MHTGLEEAITTLYDLSFSSTSSFGRKPFRWEKRKQAWRGWRKNGGFEMPGIGTHTSRYVFIDRLFRLGLYSKAYYAARRAGSAKRRWELVQNGSPLSWQRYFRAAPETLTFYLV